MIVGIPLIAAIVAVALVLGARRAAGSRGMWTVAAVLGGWSAVAAELSLTGALARFDGRPPPLALFFVATLIVGVALALSRTGRSLATLPLPLLVGFHVFRLPLELVMHQAAAEGTMPAQMSFDGSNFDIVSGITAGVLALVLARREVPPAIVLAWNVLGTLLLLAIVTIAFTSTPMFHAFGTRPEQLNTWVAYFPFVYLALCVMGALIGHVVVFRRLLGTEPRSSAHAAGPARHVRLQR
ncbi:MAG: hypothetical protein JWM74_1004 [Myxococcaceae bacterium]|nr:hypothetical protein [Myxococcaceae bacterium]